MAAQFLRRLGPPLEDAYEETYALASLTPSKNLGMYSPTSSTLTLTINKHTHTLTQSPALLASSHASGTTGAVLWSITPHLARYLTSPLRPTFLTASSTILELGCGVAALLAASVGPTVAHYLQTDIQSITKLASQNLLENTAPHGRKRGAPRGKVETAVLDWETDDLASHPALRGVQGPLTAVISCDCVYNEGLVPALVDTLIAACKLHREEEDKEEKTVVMVAMEVRSPDVLECFLDAFMARFDVWRVPEDMLPVELGVRRGYALHVGTLRG